MNIFKLKEYINQLNDLNNKINEIKNDDSIDHYQKKIIMSRMQEDENVILSHIKRGIVIKDSILLNEVRQIIVDFLGQFECSKEEVINSLSDVNLFTSDIPMGYGGLLVNFGNNIGIDFRFVEFDNEGYFKGFKKEYYPFLKYTLVHELLHKCSIFKNQNNNFSFSDDALSEGCTDMLALMATNGYEYGSKNYDFFVKVCSFFTTMVGMEKIVDDYFNNIGKWPNLKNLFYQCGLNDNDFSKFASELNKLLEMTIMANNNKELIPIVEQKQIQLISFLKENILNKNVSEDIIHLDNMNNAFYQLFSNYDSHLVSSSKHSK